jgi:serine/threonine protein kinase
VWQPNGRAADIFSLACVLLEIAVLHEQGSLEHIRKHRSADPSFHKNLQNVGIWCMPLEQSISVPRLLVVQDIRRMLSRDPEARPEARKLFLRMCLYDYISKIVRSPGILDDCCIIAPWPAEQDQDGLLRWKTFLEPSPSRMDTVMKHVSETVDQLDKVRHPLEME